MVNGKTATSESNKGESYKADPTQRVRTHNVGLMDPRPHRTLESKSQLAARALSNAAEQRCLARGSKEADYHLREADRLEGVAAALMRPEGTPTVKSGEVAVFEGYAGLPSEIADTLAIQIKPQLRLPGRHRFAVDRGQGDGRARCRCGFKCKCIEFL